MRVKDNTKMPFYYLIRSDGGNIQNPRNISMILSSIYKFLSNNLNFLTHLVTAADISYVDEVKRIMPFENAIL